MLTSITIVSTPSNIEIPIIGSTIANKYIVKSIDGLGPPDISVVIGDLASDGGVYQNRRVPQRNPVLTLGFNPDYSQNETVDDLRDALYLALIEPGGDTPLVEIVLHDNAKPDRSIFGYVEKFDISLFDKDPEVDISILCADPYLRGAVAGFVPASPGTIDVDNPGTAPCGFIMDLTFTASASVFSLARGGSVLLYLNYFFFAGDRLQINTIPGQRLVQIIRSGTTHNLIASLTDLDAWPTFRPGHDELVTNDGGIITWNNIQYTPLWWGV